MDELSLQKAVEELHNAKLMYGSPKAPFWFVGLEEALVSDYPLKVVA